MNRLVSGLAAGAVGTSLLNAVTYLDMAVRGRPSSSVPADSVEKLGVPLGDDPERAEARKEGLGALLGFVTGFAGGAVVGLLRPGLDDVPWPVAGALVGAGVMAATDGVGVALGTTDPRSWSTADWLSDLAPHLAYGVGTVLVVDALALDRR